MDSIIQTPHTSLRWRGLAGWVNAAQILAGRPGRSAARYQQHKAHLAALGEAAIYQSECRHTLTAALRLLTNPGAFQQPARGQRGSAPHTPLIVAIRNRIAQLDRAADLDAIPLGHNSHNR